MVDSAHAAVDLRHVPADPVLVRVEQGLNVRLDRDTLVSKRRSLGARTERGTSVRIERRAFERIGQQGWNGTEAAAVLLGVVMPRWYQGVTWREADEPVMWRADELELVTSQPVGTGARVREAPGLPEAWWAGLNGSLDALSSQHTYRIATPDTERISQELVTGKLGEVFPSVTDTRVGKWVPAHGDLTWANVMGPVFCLIDWEDWGMAPRGLDAVTLWGNALAVPALAARVYRERQADMQSRDGKLMALYVLSKIVGPHAREEDPLLVPARREAARLVADLQT
ncbi:hypothetical protein ACFWP3_07775 [Streptomyces sp. NPDC058525]|uniref:hypothetical protein n=1 Tax=Streptomyces sp. NPDC058525 TaxID=3346538 RepID=UPI00365284A2